MAQVTLDIDTQKSVIKALDGSSRMIKSEVLNNRVVLDEKEMGNENIRADVVYRNISMYVTRNRSGMVVFGLFLFALYMALKDYVPGTGIILGGLITVMLTFFSLRIFSVVRTNANRVYWHQPKM